MPWPPWEAVALPTCCSDEALTLLADAPRRCRRLPDSYLWVEAYALDALCGLAVEHATLAGASA
ncbi:MAG: hypothetical protein WD250_04955 [Egibacteraceae bacterium]